MTGTPTACCCGRSSASSSRPRRRRRSGRGGRRAVRGGGCPLRSTCSTAVAGGLRAGRPVAREGRLHEEPRGARALGRARARPPRPSNRTRRSSRPHSRQGHRPLERRHVPDLFLTRPDVLAVGDLGIRKAAERLYGLTGLASPAELTRLAEPWRPWRSLGCVYLWRSLEAVPVDSGA